MEKLKPPRAILKMELPIMFPNPIKENAQVEPVNYSVL